MRRLRWSAAARSDLSAIARRSQSQWGAAQRNRYVGELRARLDQLRERPELGPPYRPHRPGLRKLTVGAHIAFYRHGWTYLHPDRAGPELAALVLRLAWTHVAPKRLARKQGL